MCVILIGSRYQFYKLSLKIFVKSRLQCKFMFITFFSIFRIFFNRRNFDILQIGSRKLVKDQIY